MKRRHWHFGSSSLIVLAIFTLSTLSLVSLFAIYYNDQTAGQRAFNPWYQLAFTITGFAVMFALARINLQLLERSAVWFYLVSLALLAGVLTLADPINGATRWFDLGIIQFQPAELAKLSVVVLLSHLLARRAQTMRLGTIMLAAMYTMLPAALIILQPDLGTAIIFVVIWVGMLTVTPMHRGILVAILAIGIGLTALSLPFLADYQRARITTFLNPAADPRGAGYNSRQAMIAVGSGQLSGRGLDGGSQSQLNFLPSQHTDFIFAVVAEKLGFIGAGMVIVGFIALVTGMIAVARQVTQLFGAYLIAGIVSLIGFQALVNIAMNLGLAPVTGVPLPFLSYGGTHTIVGFAAAGLVLGSRQAGRPLGFRH